MIVDLKSINCGKRSHSGNYSRKSQILLILGEITMCLQKRLKKKKKNTHILKLGVERNPKFTDFQRSGSGTYAKKSCI